MINLRFMASLLLIGGLAACASEPSSATAGLADQPRPVASEGTPGTEVPRIANRRHLYDHTAPDGVKTSVDFGDVTFAVHFATGSPTSPPCRVPCATTPGLLVSYQMPDGRTGKVPIVASVPSDGSTSSASPSTGDVGVIGTIGLTSDHDGPSAVGVRVSARTARVAVDLRSGPPDEIIPVDGWVAFVSAHGMTNLRAFDSGGNLLAACEPVPRASGCG